VLLDVYASFVRENTTEGSDEPTTAAAPAKKPAAAQKTPATQRTTPLK
jgi:hypothetical protein